MAKGSLKINQLKKIKFSDGHNRGDDNKLKKNIDMYSCCQHESTASIFINIKKLLENL